MENLLLLIFHFFRMLGLGGVFLSMLIENIGVPLPTEIGYLIGQELVNLGKYHYWLILAVTTGGHVLGSLASYGFGRRGDFVLSRRIRESNKIVRVHEKLAKWYQKYGDLTIFISRFIGYVRPWSSYIAGFAGVRFWPFFIYTLIGSLIFNIFNLYFANIFILIWRKYTIFHLAIIWSIGLIFFALVIYELLKLFKKKVIR